MTGQHIDFLEGINKGMDLIMENWWLCRALRGVEVPGIFTKLRV